MTERKDHSYIPTLKKNFAEGKIDRREFLRTSTLLGLSAGAAYAFVGKVTGESFVPRAKAAMPQGGTMRLALRVIDIKDPHTFQWVRDSNVARQTVEYMSKTGTDNVTRPSLLESWEASDDLKTWTLNVRKGVKWHNGRGLDADDIIWNLNHVLDAKTGSSVLGLMKGYMLEEYDTGEKDDKGAAKMSTRLWDANAIEKVDSHTVRLNAKEAQLAVPEHLFHYPFPVLDPEEGGKFGPGSNGTGAFNLVEHDIGKKSVLTARKDYWGDGPNIDRLEYLDLGDDPAAALAALASKQVHGSGEVLQILSLDAVKALPHLQIHEVATAQTAVVRGKVGVAPWDDPRVMKALRLATDTPKILQLAYRGLGAPGEHHHVCPIHPEYAKLPFMSQDIAAAKALLAEAGHPGGIDAKIDLNGSENWEVNAAQGMKEQWNQAGFRIDLNVLPGAQFWEIWAKTPFGMTSWTHRPLGVMVLGLAYRKGVPWNESDFDNPRFDALLTKAEGILDVDARREVMVELQTIMQEEGPIVQPLWRAIFTAMDKRVQGFAMHPTNYLFANEWA
ncbi:MAG: ABC transporter substrate-binding protein, partial [Alphaproteobacteria bacterium]